jgi:hypothetical protein
MRYEPGRYRGRITGHGAFKSPAGQQLPTVFLTFDLIGRYDPATGELGPCPPGTRTFTRAITANTFRWLLADLKTIGFDKNGLKYLDPGVPGAADLCNREVDFVCIHEAYQGLVRERWSIGRGPRTKLAQGDLEELDARFGEAPERKSGDGPDADPTTVRDPGDET